MLKKNIIVEKKEQKTTPECIKCHSKLVYMRIKSHERVCRSCGYVEKMNYSVGKNKKEQIEGFNKAYKIIKKNGFQKYFCLGNTTWEEAKNNFDKGMNLQEEVAIMILEGNVKVVLSLKKGETVPVCESCKRIMDPQEYRAGFKKCEHCDGVCGCNSIKEAKKNE